MTSLVVGPLLRRLLPRALPPLARYFYTSPPEAHDDKAQLARKFLRPRRRRVLESFEEIPNILIGTSKLKMVRVTENPVDLNGEREYPYGIDIAIIREWIEMARATILHGRLFSRMNRKQSDIPTIAPILLLSYSAENGDILLSNTAMGIARSLGADFLSIDVDEFGKVGTFLTTNYLNLEDESGQVMNGDTKMSDILKEMPPPGPIFERQRFDLRPTHNVLRYLEFCMSKIPGAASLRVIYIHGHFNSNFRMELATVMADRPANSPDTLFILSEGSNFCPNGARGAKYSFEMSREDIEVTANLTDKGLALTSKQQTAFGQKSFDPSFTWMIDDVLKAPRILIAPPTDMRLAGVHRRQIKNDVSWMNFNINYSIIHSTLAGMSTTDKYLSLILNEMPQSKDSFSRLPSLHKRLWSPAEITALCLSMPTTEEVEPAETFIRTVQAFAANRNQQMKAIPFLTSGSASPTGDSEELKDTHPGLGELNKYEKRLQGSIVFPSMVKTKYDDIGALENVKRTLYELISLRLERPDYFTKGILRDAVSGILLFGPPGTGKTMLARAVAAQSGASFLAIQSSAIFDKYVGEGEKNVKAVFSLARKLTPCIIFLDEVDALLDHRSHSLGRASRVEIINEFMSEWDGLLQQNQGITVMAATNRPFALDDAVLRRLPRRVLVDLPDPHARAEILKLLLRENELSHQVNLSHIADRCEYYSGSDLKSMCMAAATRALRRLRGRDTNVTLMELIPEDFEGAMSDVPPSLSDRMSTLMELRDWDSLYGEGRVQKSQNPFGFS